MALPWALGLFVAGIGIVIVSAERLADSVVGVSRHAGVSAFLLSVLFIGFDAENLAVGIAAGADGTAGLALGSIVGSAMVALALALGLTALVVPLRLRSVPARVLLLPVAVALLLQGLAADGRLSRLDGALLLGGYAVVLWRLIRWERRGLRIVPQDAPEDDVPTSRWRAVLWFGGALVGVVVGSELLLRGARPLIGALGWTDTLFGMTILALLVSVEEVARELPAALKGRPDVSIGNVIGSALAFFGLNAGVIALVRPIPVGDVTRWFYLPVCVGTLGLVAALVGRGRVPRWAGGVLLMLYAVFVAVPLMW